MQVGSRTALSWSLAGIALIIGVTPALAFDALMVPVGESDGDEFGWSVGAAGDVNGDGYPDVIVGAPRYGYDPTTWTSQGRAYIYYGGPGADDTPDVILSGTSSPTTSSFGCAVAGAGDVNADGYADVIVATGDDHVYVFYGGTQMDSVPDIVIRAGVTLVGPVAGVGDLNGDGYDDFIVGEEFDSAAGPNAGRASVYYGGAQADAQADLVLTGTAPGEFFGASVGSAGDVNGDGYTDVIVGGFGWPGYGAHGGYGAGRAYVYYGGPSADDVPDLILTGRGVADEHFGLGVTTAGDVNGDGFADVMVSAGNGTFTGDAYTPRVYIYYGGVEVDTTPDIVLQPFFGAGSAGDVNKDGYGDILLHGPGVDYVHFEGPGSEALADITLAGCQDFSGAAAEDVNGDGYPDVIVGAPAPYDQGRGQAYVFSLMPASLTSTVDLQPHTINLDSESPWVTVYIEPNGFSPNEINASCLRLGYTVSPDNSKPTVIGDYNLNGKPDLMVRFSRIAVNHLLAVGKNELALTGWLTTGKNFEGKCDVQVIDRSAARLSPSISPNPLNPQGVLTFTTSQVGRVKVAVFDIHGRLVRILVDSPAVTAGIHDVRIDGLNDVGHPLATGVYFYRIDTPEASAAGKITILR